MKLHIPLLASFTFIATVLGNQIQEVETPGWAGLPKTDQHQLSFSSIPPQRGDLRPRRVIHTHACEGGYRDSPRHTVAQTGYARP